MSEKSIIFSTLVVKAILDGRKTVTRRVIKEIPADYRMAKKPQSYGPDDYCFVDLGDPIGTYPTLLEAKYKKGDILWVKESWKFIGIHNDGRIGNEYGLDIVYVADDTHRTVFFTDSNEWFMSWPDKPKLPANWHELGTIEKKFAYTELCHKEKDRTRSSRSMPKWAARILLEVLDVRPERVQEITEEDAIKEGIEIGCAHGEKAYYLYDERLHYTPDPIESYRTLWDKLIAKRGYPWESNPWVRRIEFKVLSE